MLLITRISRFLTWVEFPAMREDIIAAAIDYGVEDDVISELADLPYDQYNSKDEVLSVITEKQHQEKTA